jgi:capsular polysaccharide transport system permease protein
VQQTGETIASDETYAVNAYLTSRDIVDLLAKNNNLRAILGRPGADFLFRYPTFWLPDDKEFLYRRFQWMGRADVDPVTGISTIEVNAFTPEDAQTLTRGMIGYAEALVNRMNDRAYQDSLAMANVFVAEAQKEVDEIEAQLQKFRNLSGSIDPKLVSESKLKVIGGLSTQLAQIEATIAQQAAVTPTSPALTGLRAQAQSYRGEIEKRKLEIAGSVGSEATKLETYEQLTLRRELAAKALAAAAAQRDQARQDAERQHLYIQMITQPNLSSDFARYPRVTLDLFALLAICLAVFQLLRRVGEVAAEHRP